MMIRLLIMLAIALTATGCGASKKLKEQESNKAILKLDSSATTITTVKEKADTTVKIAGASQNGGKPVENILQGDSLVVESERQRIVVDFDPLTRNIRARGEVKEMAVPIQIDRETTVAQRDEVKRETSVEAEKSTVQKESEGASGFTGGFFLGIFLLLILVVIGLLLMVRYG